jgi:hypothetical protein
MMGLFKPIPTMKHSLIISLAASFAVFLALPLDVELAISAIFTAGLGLIFSSDYRPRTRLLDSTRVSAAQRSSERLRLAA